MREPYKALLLFMVAMGLFSLGVVVVAGMLIGRNMHIIPNRAGTAVFLCGTAITLCFTFGAMVAWDNYKVQKEIARKPPPAFREHSRSIPVNNGDDTDIMDFSSTHTNINGRLVGRDGNNLILGRLDYSTNEWRKLSRFLQENNWNWNRKILQRTGIWEGLTNYIGAYTRYEIVVREFEELDVVKVDRKPDGGIKKVTVLPAGKDAICRMGGSSSLL